MTKAIALIALAAIQIGVMLANYWFTFGLWPKSWTSFVLCAVSSIAIMLTSEAVRREGQK